MKKCLFLITLFLTALVASGATWYVVPGGAGSKDGTSWANAYADVQTAIDSAYNTGRGEVWIAKGTYKHGSAMTMKNGVHIYGGFAGTETSKEERVAGNETILDGENQYLVFHNTNINLKYLSAKLDNLTIQNGIKGIYNLKCQIEITNCTFVNNGWESLGGGMCNDSSDLTLANCTFVNNKAHFGGGIYNKTSSSLILNCTFVNNKATSGGGIYNDSSSNPTLTNCTLFNNSASSGSGLYNNNKSTPTIKNCIFWNDILSGNKCEIYNNSNNTSVSVDTCIIQNGRSGIFGNSTGSYITADPKLINLGYYGGFVPTCPVLTGSSAIGAGRVVEELTTDARGFKRLSKPTIGACEYQSQLTGVSITTSEGYAKYSSKYEFTLNANVSDVEGTFSYQWYKDGEQIEGATSATYKTSQKSGVSKYKVKVSDSTSTITSSEIEIETLDNPPTCYYVSTSGSSKNDGLSWATAKSDVQEAIDLASQFYGSCEVWIAKGTYKHGAAMTMKNNVAIYGGFAGTEMSKNERVSGNNVILDGENKYRVFINIYAGSNPLTNSAKLDNLTIQNGCVSDNQKSNILAGAGMYNECASPEITNCTFSNNSASNGGGMSNSNSSPVLTNCTFSGNSASRGGGIYLYRGNSILINCTFVNNNASDGFDIFNGFASDLTLINCILWGDGNFRIENFYSQRLIINTCIIKNGKSGIYENNNTSSTFTTEPITADPKLMPLGNYGGSVQTCPVGAGSSAIGAGKVVEGIYTDARGYVRSTDRTTIGAYEYNARTPTAYEKYVIENNLPNEMIDSSATPHNDGITNLEKFTFGLDASRITSYDANANFKHSTDVNGNASLQFPISVDAEGVVNVKALKSVDLINWTEITATATGEKTSDGKFKIYKLTAPVDENGKVFLKLKVEEK